MKVTGSPRDTEFGSPVLPAFPESRYSRGQRSKILWAFGELLAPNPSALSSAHPLPQNSKQLIAPKLFLERLHSRKTEARNISKAWPQLSAGAHLKSLRAENLLLPSKRQPLGLLSSESCSVPITLRASCLPGSGQGTLLNGGNHIQEQKRLDLHDRHITPV